MMENAYKTDDQRLDPETDWRSAHKNACEKRTAGRYGLYPPAGCYIDPTHCFLIEIGNNVTLSIRVTLLAHDASTKKCLGFTKIGKIRIGDNVFIGANATVLPGVCVGDNCVIGANSVVTKNVPENTVVTGNPARVVCSLSEFREKNGALMENTKVFGREYRFPNA